MQFAQAPQEDRFSDETRRARRSLEVASVAGLLTYFLDLVPQRVSALGVELSEGRQDRFLWALATLIAVLLIAFCIYVISDATRFTSNPTNDPKDPNDPDDPLFDAYRARLNELADRLGEAVGSEAYAGVLEDHRAIVNKMARLRFKATVWRAARRTGLLRLVAEIFAPSVLAIVAVALLVARAA